MRVLLIFLLLFVTTRGAAQEQESAPSWTPLPELQKRLETARTDFQVFYARRDLGFHFQAREMYDSLDRQVSQLELLGEQSSDYKLKVDILLELAVSFTYKGTPEENQEKGLRLLERANEIARANKDEVREGWTYYDMALLYRDRGWSKLKLHGEMAMKALEIAKDHPESEKFYIASHRLVAIYFLWERNFEQALRYADKALVRAIQTGNINRIRNAYTTLLDVYSRVGDTEKYRENVEKRTAISREHYKENPGWECSDLENKAIELRTEALDELSFKDLLSHKPRVNAVNRSLMEQAAGLLERAAALMWKHKIQHSTGRAYYILFWVYFWMDRPDKIAAFRNADTAYYGNWERRILRKSTGIMRAAELYLNKQDDSALALLNATSLRSTDKCIIAFICYLRKGQPDSMIAVLERGNDWFREWKLPVWQQSALLCLDSLYRQRGDVVRAGACLQEYIRLEDSLDKLELDKKLWSLQLSNTEKKINIEKELEQRAVNRRHSLQYMGIVIGIVALFIILAMMGVYQVSRRTIRIISFFSFLLFFEFIFLLFKKYFYFFTKGEPLKELMVMVAIAALLVPLHHWVEHYVYQFLTSRKFFIGRKKGRVSQESGVVSQESGAGSR